MKGLNILLLFFVMGFSSVFADVQSVKVGCGISVKGITRADYDFKEEPNVLSAASQDFKDDAFSRSATIRLLDAQCVNGDVKIRIKNISQTKVTIQLEHAIIRFEDDICIPTISHKDSRVIEIGSNKDYTLSLKMKKVLKDLEIGENIIISKLFLRINDGFPNFYRFVMKIVKSSEAIELKKIHIKQGSFVSG